MTSPEFDMTDFDPTVLLEAVKRLRHRALLGRDDSVTTFMRNLHSRLLDKLDLMAADLRDEIATFEELDRDRKTSEAGASWFYFYYIQTSFEGRWIAHGPISVLDEITVFARVEDDACLIDLNYTEVPAAELGDFADLLEAIRRETGVTVIAARV
jgi:hypothetical protein